MDFCIVLSFYGGLSLNDCLLVVWLQERCRIRFRFPFFLFFVGGISCEVGFHIEGYVSVYKSTQMKEYGVLATSGLGS